MHGETVKKIIVQYFILLLGQGEETC